MRRVLVPLDGTRLATRILPDAQRVAGTDGELMLMHDVNYPTYDFTKRTHDKRTPTDRAQAYLDALAADLREHGVNVQTQTVVLNDLAQSIDEAARIFNADLIACATHGRGPVGRLVHGGVAWRALAHSAIPVMLRHFEDDGQTAPGVFLGQRRILVPLDRSPLAEKAIPLAVKLAQEWHAPIFLIYVVPQLRPSGNPYSHMYITPSTYQADKREAQQYLDQIAALQSVEMHTRVIVGGVVASLVDAVERLSITDIVMASHGRTGLSRMVMGSVADALVHRLTCPVTIIPTLAAGHTSSATRAKKEEAILSR